MTRRTSLLSRLVQSAWQRWLYHVTRPAKYMIAAVVMALFGTIDVAIPVYQLFCALIVLLAVAEIFGFALRPKVSIAGALPEKTSVGEPVTGEFAVTNLRRRPAFDVVLGFYGLPAELSQPESERILPRLRGGSTAKLPVSLVPRRRGMYELPPLCARSSFPFNLARSGSASLPVPPLLVLPAFHPLEDLDVPLGMKYQPGGIALTSHVGESPEYIGNREYVPGEPARRLDFRSWARLAKPVVREYHEEYYCRIGLVLDTYVPPRRKAGPDGFDDLEAGISLAASVADALSGGEYILDLFAAGKQLYVFRSGRHTAHFENMLEILACLEACRSDPIDDVLPGLSEELESISTALCLFLDWDEPRRRLAHTVMEAGCRLKVFVVRDGETTLPFDLDGGELISLTPQQVHAGGLGVL